MEAIDENKSSQKLLTSSINFHRLKLVEGDSIWVFLREYYKYVLELKERAKQLLGVVHYTTESVLPTSLKFCLDRDEFEFITDCGFIEGADDYETLSDEYLRLYL